MTKLLTIFASDPIWQDPKQGYNENLSSRMNVIALDKAAIGGSNTCSITLAGNNQFCESWVVSGLGRKIVIKDHKMRTIWLGYVNSVSYNTGLYTITHGPIQEVYNRGGRYDIYDFLDHCEKEDWDNFSD